MKKPALTLLLLLLLLLVLASAAAFVLERASVAPRQLGPYIERRASGHSFDQLGVWVSDQLLALDRGQGTASLPRLRIGAQPDAAQRNSAAGNLVLVDSAEAAFKAIAQARSGDVITFAPGTYRMAGRRYVPTSSAGGVTVRADHPNTVFLEFGMSEGFLLSSPDWTFENLHIRGACSSHSTCEHAFHVVGKAANFVARNNTILDFNAHFKINGHAGAFPDNGLIEGNTISNTGARRTVFPVTPIDLVAANGWVVRSNLISDFVKAQGDRISYGAFFKGGGKHNRFERNMVVCESQLRGLPGQRVGLSLGGGGTGAAFCRDKRCLTEQDGGVIAANLIASCSDEGIYLNRAATSVLTHNTLIDTAGIALRFPETSADVRGNIIDGRIWTRDGALLRADDNRDTSVTRLFLGSHPQRALFQGAERLDLRWDGDAPRRTRAAGADTDLCGAQRPLKPSYGAFEDFAACLHK